MKSTYPYLAVALLAFLSFSCAPKTTEKPGEKVEQKNNEIPAATFDTLGNQYSEIRGTFSISGVYPHLTTYTHARTDQKQSCVGFRGDEGQAECGIGALVPWQGKLYMINYAAHEPEGSEHKLYIVDEDLNMEIFPGSVGGTPAARMIHQETEQLLIGHYVIDKAGEIRVIDIEKMPGRLTAWARHLTDPANKAYVYDMEGMLYEVDLNTLEPTKLFHNPLPGYHGKGAYTSQNRLVLANNGEPVEDPSEWKVPEAGMIGGEKRGILAEFDGQNFKVIERRQYTDLTTKNGVQAVPDEQAPLWAIGWDKRAVRLKVLDQGEWSTYLLPKAAYNNDAHHGWFTEWPRIREVGKGRFLMDMHGMFFDFPASFSASNTQGIRPIGSHLRYVPDFAHWQGKLVLATDESSIQGNPHTGQAQSNLWFGQFEDLKTWGPATAYGSIWLEDQVQANKASLPFHFAGYEHKTLHLHNHGKKACTLTIEADQEGNGNWTKLQSVALAGEGYATIPFKKEQKAEWVRLSSDQNTKLSANFHLVSPYPNAQQDQELFGELVAAKDQEEALYVHSYANHDNWNLTAFTRTFENGEWKTEKAGEFEKFSFQYAEGQKDTTANRILELEQVWTEDEASIIMENTSVFRPIYSKESMEIEETKYRLRLPKATGSYDPAKVRNFRELESERIMANIGGIFYEVPLFKLSMPPMYRMMRPVATHATKISDYTTWNGLLLMDGLKAEAKGEHVLAAGDGKTKLWMGGIDDIWKLGKPKGEGGPWKNTQVKAGQWSDMYMMTGFDKKTLRLKADKDTKVKLQVLTSHYSDAWATYKSFDLKAGEEQAFVFPAGFSAHWARLSSSEDCQATAWFVYE